MMSGLLKNDLKRSLVKAYPWDFPDMSVRTEKYAHIEVFVEDEASTSSIMGGKQNKEYSSRQEERTRQRSRSPSRKSRNGTPQNRRPRSPQRRDQRASPPRRYNDYTPLNAPRTQVLMKIRRQLSKARKLRTPPIQRNPISSACTTETMTTTWRSVSNSKMRSRISSGAVVSIGLSNGE